MEKLTAVQLQQVKKMSDDRLRTKLIAAGYEEELVMSLGREELMETYAEVLISPPPVAAAVAVDPEIEKAKLALEKQRLEAEIEEKRRACHKVWVVTCKFGLSLY